MTLVEAKKLARELDMVDLPFEHRNVWAFYDDEQGDLFVTKDGAQVNRTGAFRYDLERDEFVDMATGEAVSDEDVFGKRFFDDAPDLFVDRTTSETAELEEKIEVLLEQLAQLVRKRNIPLEALVMVCDLIRNEDETAYRRLVVLNNYLDSCGRDIDMMEFTYMHHELYELK